MVTYAKIYTRTGDKGETSLFGGKRVAKNHLRVTAYGSIDELNSLLGVVLSSLKDKQIEEFIGIIQQDLFLMSSRLAGAKIEFDSLTLRIRDMEKNIDKLVDQLPAVSHFVVPNGTESATLLYFARAVARRVERELVALSVTEMVDEKILIYMNRLSDLLYIFARFLNFKAGVSETIWKRK